MRPPPIERELPPSQYLAKILHRESEPSGRLAKRGCDAARRPHYGRV